jgi:sulfopropanediol 3-dehydrogenase
LEYIKRAAKTAESDTEKIRGIVHGILDDIEQNGEQAVVELARKFDGWEGDFILSQEKKQRLIDSVPETIKQDIRFAHEQVYGFAKAQRESIREFEKETLPGVRLGQRIIPMKVAGCYIPGGRFAHACSAVMSVATAKAAGVETVIACSPPVG